MAYKVASYKLIIQKCHVIKSAGSGFTGDGIATPYDNQFTQVYKDPNMSSRKNRFYFLHFSLAGISPSNSSTIY